MCISKSANRQRKGTFAKSTSASEYASAEGREAWASEGKRDGASHHTTALVHGGQDGADQQARFTDQTLATFTG